MPSYHRMSFSARTPLLLYIGTALSAGCETEPPTAFTAPDGPSLSVLGRLDVAEQAIFPGDEPYLAIATDIPEFAGYFLDGETVVARTTRSETFAAVRGVVESARLGAAASRGLRQAGSMDVQLADFSFVDLAGWRNDVIPELVQLEAFQSIGLDFRANRIAIGLKEEAAQAVSALLTRHAVPEEAVSVRVVGAARVDVDLSDRQRPLDAGFGLFNYKSLSQYGSCTISFFITYGSSLGYLTNSHCTEPSDKLWNEGGWFPMPTYQLDPTSGTDFIGSEVADPAPWSCFGSLKCRRSDAARFSLSLPSDSVHLGAIARTQSWTFGWGAQGSTTINGSIPRWWITAEDAYPSQGEFVNKMGRNGGWTTGFVYHYCSLQAGVGPYRLYCQATANYGRAAGDSGAPIFMLNGTSAATLKGIHWGATVADTFSIFSPMGGIELDLGSLTTFTPPLLTFINGPNEVPEGQACTWVASTSGGTPPYSFAWSGVLSGSTQLISGSVQDGTLYLTVTDANQSQVSDQLDITVDEFMDECIE